MKTALIAYLPEEQGKLWQNALTSIGVEVILQAESIDIIHFLENWQGRFPNLLLIDIRLKSSDGTSLQSSSVCRWCREHRPDLKVVLVNSNEAHVGKVEQSWATRLGAAAIVPKLFESTLIPFIKQISDILGLELEQDALKAFYPPDTTTIQSTLQSPQSVPEPLTPQQTQSADSYFKQSKSLFQSGQLQPALDQLHIALRLKPNYLEAICLRGDIYGAMGEYERALEEYSEAIAQDRGYVDAYCKRGMIQYRFGDNQSAIKDFDRAIQIDAKSASAYNGRGLAKFRSGDEQGASRDYDMAIKLNANFAEAYNNRGTLRYAIGDVQGASKDYTQALKIDLTYADAFYNRGNIRSDLGKFREAIDDYSEAVKNKPDFALAYGNRGLAYYEIDRVKEAIADTKKAADIFFERGDTQSYEQAMDTIKQMR